MLTCFASNASVYGTGSLLRPAILSPDLLTMTWAAVGRLQNGGSCQEGGRCWDWLIPATRQGLLHLLASWHLLHLHAADLCAALVPASPCSQPAGPTHARCRPVCSAHARPLQSRLLQDCATHLPCPGAGAPRRTAFCCTRYTPEVLAVLRRLHKWSGLCAGKPLARAGLPERSLLLDGVTTAYRYVHKDEGIPARFF